MPGARLGHATLGLFIASAAFGAAGPTAAAQPPHTESARAAALHSAGPPATRSGGGEQATTVPATTAAGATTQAASAPAPSASLALERWGRVLRPDRWPAMRHAPLAPASPTMSGDWFGLRTALDDAGVQTRVYLNDTYQWVIKGGRARLGHNGATIDWLTTFDLERMGLLPGATILSHVKREWGRGVNPYTASIWQVQDDQDGDYSLYVDQLWYEQRLLDDRLRLRAGFLDFQTIFDRNVVANSEDQHFFNQALDNNPFLPLHIGLGAAATLQPVSWFSFTAGAGDAESWFRNPGFGTAFHDRARFISFFEPAFHVKLPALLGEGPLPGNLRLGLVYDPRVRRAFEDPRHDPPRNPTRGDDWSFYANFDQMLLRERADDVQGLYAFGRYGLRRGDVFRESNFWSAGLRYDGLLPGRERDMLGFAIAQGVASREFRNYVREDAGSETVYEIFYSIQVTGWLTITPDVQYVSHPGLGDEPPEALIVGLRARISF